MAGKAVLGRAVGDVGVGYDGRERVEAVWVAAVRARQRDAAVLLRDNLSLFRGTFSLLVTI